MSELIHCRRSNYVQAAYVEASIRINAIFGSDRAYWILIRERVPAAVIERVLKGQTVCLRRKRSRYVVRVDRGDTPSSAPTLRTDQLSAQRVEVALVFQAMLGTEAAAEYLRSSGMPVWITVRVLGSTRHRPSPVLVPDEPGRGVPPTHA